uniref:Site-specific integrase n=1 Tax=Candidatus Caldatribacterium saccharofermentans TaxID=1454753 RepID=A0A7V4WKD9_9BACT
MVGVPASFGFEGKELSVEAFSRRLRKYSRKTGYPVTPYDLHHSFAILFLRGGGNVFALQRTLGHADLSMTKRYLALTHEDLCREHERATPVNLLVKKRMGGVSPCPPRGAGALLYSRHTWVAGRTCTHRRALGADVVPFPLLVRLLRPGVTPVGRLGVAGEPHLLPVRPPVNGACGVRLRVTPEICGQVEFADGELDVGFGTASIFLIIHPFHKGVVAVPRTYVEDDDVVGERSPSLFDPLPTGRGIEKGTRFDHLTGIRLPLLFPLPPQRPPHALPEG